MLLLKACSQLRENIAFYQGFRLVVWGPTGLKMCRPPCVSSPVVTKVFAVMVTRLSRQRTKTAFRWAGVIRLWAVLNTSISLPKSGVSLFLLTMATQLMTCLILSPAGSVLAFAGSVPWGLCAWTLPKV